MITHTVARLKAGSMWHGTTLGHAMSIQQCGYIRASSEGFFGPGVYLTSSRSKAKAWARFASHYDKHDPSAIVRVKANIGRCKVFDMCEVEDVHVCMNEYEDFHCTDVDTLGRPKGDPNSVHPVGRLSWLRESFDSQYIPETWPANSAQQTIGAIGRFWDAIWPDAMKGDELILRHELNAAYISHEIFS